MISSKASRFCTFASRFLAGMLVLVYSHNSFSQETDEPTNTAAAKSGKHVEIKMLLSHTRFATRSYTIDSGVKGPTVFIVGGVHGNEPAGALAAEAIRHWDIQTGRMIVIPAANVPGLAANLRLIPGLDTNLNNLNRNYPKAGETGGARGELAQAIWQIALDEKPDWVLDLHEGFDFHQVNDKSVGSSIICFPLTNGQVAANLMLTAVNATIESNIYKFVRREMPIDASLARAAGEHLKVPGMTIETTKTQPMEKRIEQQEVIVHRLLQHIGMVTGDFTNDAASKKMLVTDIRSLIVPPKIGVALYKGPGTGGNGPPNLMKRLNTTSDTWLTEVTPAEIREGVLKNYDVVIFAGGSGSKEAEALGEKGREQVQNFVRNGGGYVGICAGAYLATSGYPWSLHIINAKTLSPKWARGKATLNLELTSTGTELLGATTNHVEVLYHNGPVVGPCGVTNLPPYEVLAYYRTEVAEKDSPKGIMVNSPAIFAGQYSMGKVVCVSPHPEQTDGLDYIIPNAVRWVSLGGSKSAQ